MKEREKGTGSNFIKLLENVVSKRDKKKLSFKK